MSWVNPLDQYQWGTPEDPNAFTQKDYDRAIAGGLNALEINHYAKLGNNGRPYNIGPNAQTKINEGLKANPLWSYAGYDKDPKFFGWEAYQKALKGGLTPLDIAWNLNKAGLNLHSSAEGVLVNDLNTWEGYKGQLDTVNNQYSSLSNQYNTLNSQYSNLNSQYTGAKQQYDALSGQYSTLQGNYGSLQGNYNSLSSKYSGLESQHKGVQDQYSALSGTYTDLQKNFNDLQSRYSLEKQDLTGKLTNTQTLYDRTKQDYTNLQGEYGNLNALYSSQGNDLARLRSDYTGLQGRYDTLDAQYRSYGTDLSNLRTDYTGLQNRYADLERTYGQANLQLTGLQSEYSGLQNRYADLEKNYGSLRGENDRYLSDIENYKKQTFDYQNQLSSAGTRIAGLETQVGDLNNLSTRYKLESENYRDKANQYESDLFGANQRIGVFERDISDYQKRVGGLETDLSNYRTQFETAKINYEKTLAQRQLDYDLLNSNYTIAQAERERLNQDVNRYREEAISQQISGLRAGDNRGSTPATGGSESLTPGGTQVRTSGNQGTVVDVRDELSDGNSVLNRRGPVVQALSSQPSGGSSAGRATGAQAPALASGAGQYYARRFA